MPNFLGGFKCLDGFKMSWFLVIFVGDIYARLLFSTLAEETGDHQLGFECVPP